MPRQARLDAPGTLHYVMLRGIERRAIVTDNADRHEFVSRLGASAMQSRTSVYLITHKFQPQLTGDRATEESAQRHERVEEPDQRVGSGG